MASGTGKTLTALWIAEALKAERVLVLLPSLLLLSKTLQEWVKVLTLLIAAHILRLRRSTQPLN